MKKLHVYRNACKVGEENASGYSDTDDISVSIFGDKIVYEDRNDEIHEFTVHGTISRNERVVEKLYEITNHKIYYVIDYTDVGMRTIQEVHIYNGENHENYTLVYTSESMNVIDNMTGDSFIVSNYSDRNLESLDQLEKHRAINEYMTPSEAAHCWGIDQERVKNKLKPSVVGQDTLDKLINNGLIKCFQKPDGQRKEWIISRKVMEEWFGKKDN